MLSTPKTDKIIWKKSVRFVKLVFPKRQSRAKTIWEFDLAYIIFMLYEPKNADFFVLI